MTFDVPVLSLKDLHDPAGRALLAERLGAAARNSGFLQIIDHGVPASLVARAFAVTQQVFALPLETKLQYARNTHTNRGYDVLAGQALKGAIGIGHEDVDKNGNVAETGDPDLKEGWMIGPDGVDDRFEYAGRFGHGPNVLPTEEQVPGVRAVAAEYYTAMLSLATELMKLFALSLDVPEDAFDELCRLPAAALRLLHYPPEVEGTGAGAHTDFGLCTILATSGAPGLELYTGTTWVPVEPAPGAFIVNVGDMLSLYTGGEYKSSLHRVMNRTGVERYSIPFFLDGNSDVLVAPVCGPGKGQLQPVTVEQHLRTKFDASYFDPTAAAAMQTVVAGPVLAAATA